jgi:hypothetical protein
MIFLTGENICIGCKNDAHAGPFGCDEGNGSCLFLHLTTIMLPILGYVFLLTCHVASHAENTSFSANLMGSSSDYHWLAFPESGLSEPAIGDPIHAQRAETSQHDPCLIDVRSNDP